MGCENVMLFFREPLGRSGILLDSEVDSVDKKGDGNQTSNIEEGVCHAQEGSHHTAGIGFRRRTEESRPGQAEADHTRTEEARSGKGPRFNSQRDGFRTWLSWNSRGEGKTGSKEETRKNIPQEKKTVHVNSFAKISLYLPSFYFQRESLYLLSRSKFCSYNWINCLVFEVSIITFQQIFLFT